MLAEHVTPLIDWAMAWPVANTLESNAILVLVLVVMFVAVVIGFFTYTGSGISTHPVAGTAAPPGSRRQDEFSAFAARNPVPHDLTQIADGVYQMSSFPAHSFNSYLIAGDGDKSILVDAGTRHSARRILRQLHGHSLAALVLTHAHPDHQGASKTICQLYDIPLWCGEGDADAVNGGELASLLPSSPLNRRLVRLAAGPPYPVARRLREGDRLAEFLVIETPGVSPGHISLWRERDRVLLAGDVLLHQHPVRGSAGLYEPPERFTCDRARNRESARKLSRLDPVVVCFGHGPPLREPARFREFAAELGQVVPGD